ncbi:putative carbonic anhydrase 3 isoform X2 [Antedon mediterranea]
MVVTNNGHSLQIDLTGDYSVSGGGLGGTYKTAQFHFHWGSRDAVGSEHTLNNVQYPVEMHIVHYNSIYSSTTDAVQQGGSTGLAVLGFFFQVSDEDNANFETLLSSLTNVQEEGDTYNIPPNDVFTLESLLPDNLVEFYRYNGSLTTPGCNEAVIWTMFKELIYLSSTQIQMLRTLRSGNKIIQDNFRPLQALNGRIVTYSRDPCNPDPCQSSPCKEKETCLIEAQCRSYFCCVTYDPCEDQNVCMNGGTCSVGPRETCLLYECTCPPCYSGTNCENYTNPCESSPCQNGGLCLIGSDCQYFCII